MRNLNKFLVVVLALISFINYAQTNKYGIRAGVGIPNLKSTDNNIYSKDYKSVTGFDGSFFADFGITENFSIKAELGFLKKGGERNGMQPVPTATLNSTPEGEAFGEYLDQIGVETIYADFESRAVFPYIEIPILAKYEWNIGKTWGVYVNGGPYIDFMLSPKQITKSGTSEQPLVPIFKDENGMEPVMVPYPPDYIPGPAFGNFNAETDISKDLETIDFGAMFGVGITAAISNHSELLFDVRGSYGFIPLKNDKEIYGTVHMGNMSFALGYAYTFESKVQKPVKK